MVEAADGKALDAHADGEGPHGFYKKFTKAALKPKNAKPSSPKVRRKLATT
jgi:hypothetical protein